MLIQVDTSCCWCFSSWQLIQVDIGGYRLFVLLSFLIAAKHLYRSIVAVAVVFLLGS